MLLNCAFERSEQASLVVRGGIEVLRKIVVSVTAIVLDFVEGKVSFTQQLAWILLVLREKYDADADACHDLIAVDCIRPGKRLNQFFRQCTTSFRNLHIRLQNHE